MPEFDHRLATPTSRRTPGVSADVGVVFNDSDRRARWLYGQNPTDEALYFAVSVAGELFELTIPPRSGRLRIRLPLRLNLTLGSDDKGRDVVEGYDWITWPGGR